MGFDGADVGWILGCAEGRREGCEVGLVGEDVGCDVGMDGRRVGWLVGSDEGENDGAAEGLNIGAYEGPPW